ncbi:MAG: T9SS type A sorting domain-containing protein [Saprospiraceae bacterium]|nr:T9SS type A sorting domain-containing protein [Saprospiraceae bacterium]
MNQVFSTLKSFLTVLIFTLGAIMAKAGDPPSHHNWSIHPMGTYEFQGPDITIATPCVQLAMDNMLYINLYVDFLDPNLKNYPAMRFQYRFYVNNQLVVSSLTQRAGDSKMTTFIDDNGVTLNRVKYTIPYNCSAHCSESLDDEESFMFKLEYQLMQEITLIGGNGGSVMVPYPIAEFQGEEELWPANIFDIPSEPGLAPEIAEEKRICCGQWNKPIHPIIGNNDEVVYGDVIVEKAQQGEILDAGYAGLKIDEASKISQNSLVVRPNPFVDDVAIKFNLSQASRVEIDCIDTQGRIIKSVHELMNSGGTYETKMDLLGIPSGLYYFRVQTLDGVKMVKMVKNSD